MLFDTLFVRPLYNNIDTTHFYDKKLRQGDLLKVRVFIAAEGHPGNNNNLM